MSSEPRYVLHCAHTGRPVGEGTEADLRYYYNMIGHELPPDLRDQGGVPPSAGPGFVPPPPEMK